jgi:hypothetical protein
MLDDSGQEEDQHEHNPCAHRCIVCLGGDYQFPSRALYMGTCGCLPNLVELCIGGQRGQPLP